MACRHGTPIEWTSVEQVEPWRRWTGIEPAGRGSPVPTALKAAEPTRCPDTSTPTLRDRRDRTRPRRVGSRVAYVGTLASPTSPCIRLRLRALGAWSWSHSVGLPRVAAEPRSSRRLSRSASGATRCSSTSTVNSPPSSACPNPTARASTTGCVQRRACRSVWTNSSSTPTRTTSLLPLRRSDRRTGVGRPSTTRRRWSEFADWLRRATRRRDRGLRRRRSTGTAPRSSLADGRPGLLVTRPCYLSLRRARRSTVRADRRDPRRRARHALSVRDVERCARGAGRRHGQRRSGDRPGRRRGAAGRPASLGRSDVSSEGRRVTPRTATTTATIDVVLAGICARAVVERRRRCRDRRRRGPAGLARSTRRRSTATRATGRRPARAGSATSTSCSRPDGRRGARQRRLRDLGRPRRHGHLGRSPPRPAGRAPHRTDTGADRSAHRPHLTDRRRPPRRRVAGLRGPAAGRRRRRRAVDPTLPRRHARRSTNSSTGPAARRCCHEILGGALQRVGVRRHLVRQDVAAVGVVVRHRGRRAGPRHRGHL